MDIASGKAKVVGNDPWMVPARTVNPVWSPDSKWVAYSSHLKSLYHAIFISNVDTGETRQVTDGLADSVWPAWDAGGKYLWFLASTDFGLKSQWLDMTSYDHDENFGLYFAVLKKGDPSPLLPESDEDKGVGSAPAAGAGAGRGGRGGRGATAADDSAQADTPVAAPAPRTPVNVQIDFDGLQQRIIAVTGVPEHQYSQLHAGVAGTVYYLESSGGGRGGAGGRRQHPPALSPERPARGVVRHRRGGLRRQRRRPQTRLSHCGRRCRRARTRRCWRRRAHAPSVFLVDADRQAPPAGAGRMNISLRMYLEPKEEFKQIFYEGWRNQRDYLYVPNMHGADWPKMKEMYGQLLPYVNHRADLNYLLDIMGAEIAIGHSYVRGGDMPAVPASPGGLLGADFAIDNGRYKITRIYDNESWNPDLRAPLSAPGVDVSVGDYIVAINGEELHAPDNIYRLLDGTANRQTVLTVNRQPSLGWRAPGHRCPRRQRTRAAHTRLGRSEPPPGRQALGRPVRLRLSAQHRTARLHQFQSLLLRAAGQAGRHHRRTLQRRRIGRRLHHRRPAARVSTATSTTWPATAIHSPVPSAGIWGPKVMIINEMAGSGGDLMPWMFRSRKVGELVGKRTWGGLVHTADTPTFIDGGSMIAPRGGFFSRDGKWAVENEGVAPDVDVENWPKDVIGGHDPQLERAVQDAMRMLKEKPVTRMTTEPSPPTWGQRKK